MGFEMVVVDTGVLPGPHGKTCANMYGSICV